VQIPSILTSLVSFILEKEKKKPANWPNSNQSILISSIHEFCGQAPHKNDKYKNQFLSLSNFKLPIFCFDMRLLRHDLM